MSEAETPTQKQARLRREKRAKKMAEQGSDRLARIKALNGGNVPPEEILNSADPEEADIETIARADIPQGRPWPGQAPAAVQDDDPMVKMMQQLTGMMGGGAPGGQQQQQDVPPLLEAMMKGEAKQDEANVPKSQSANLWRITHAIFAITLGIYIALTTSFTGSALARTAQSDTMSIFPIFATAELLLQGTRYFLEGGRLQGGGMLAMAANSGIIPPPYSNYLSIAGRYTAIFQTLASDVLVLVFILGVMSWWNQ
ncbi:hypothetical protein K470DRAFT_221558 [Piedraia hortae CBS 480.64]|uniref:GET complex, subunit GET2 n=1 Tax=Piedraia hortae CBS 480.64 TaxID=1314780 RepID=A0A6A7BTQ1_9PEZI|nr:hypothetical protein K470DRAFT_221558 [Piedraia hortae CBS 480.64]